MRVLSLIAYGVLVLSGNAFGQEDVNSVLETTDGMGSIFLPMLPAGAMDTLVIVFAGLGAVNAVSIVLEKIANKTQSEKDDKAIAKFRGGLLKVQKFVNFFIAKR
jgi:hypothetical protein